jgi:signal transduction histidine kinase
LGNRDRKGNAVHTQFLAGIVFAWVVAYIGIGLSFCIAYLIHRREPEHLLFGLHSQALAIYSIGYTLAYTHRTPTEGRFAVIIVLAGAVLAAALMLHFAVLFARIKEPFRIMRPIYGIAAALEVACIYGEPFRIQNPALVTIQLGPLVVDHLRVAPSPLGLVVAAFIGLLAIASAALLGHAVARGRRDGIAPLIGASFMTATACNDILVALGYVEGAWLAPFGNSAFVFAIAGALIVRSSLMSKELMQQSLELKRRSGELRLSYEELREAQRELTRKEQLAAVGELAAVIAHEVRNPLAIISNAVAGLRRREIGHDDRETLLTILKEESSRLNRLVGDLLRYARPVNVQRQLVSLRDIIDRTIVSTGLKDTIAMEVVVEGEPHAIWGDPGLLRQVFDNLVDNAVQAMGSQSWPNAGPKKISIAIRTEQRNGVDGVYVEVHDTGEGMEAHVRSRAMDPFFTTRPSGTGLGLAIVDRIIDAHDGEISITSTPRGGTNVSVFFPIGAPVPPSSGHLPAARDEREEALLPSERPHVKRA